MKALIPIAIVCFAASGCAPKPEAQPEASKPLDGSSTTQNGGANAGGGGGGDAITPIGPNVGAVTPVAGGENLGGGTGGGIAQIAKERARDAAGKAGTPAGTGEAGDQ